jgi:hypothetical protein
MGTMRLFLFRLLYELTALVFPCRERSAFIRSHCEDQITLYRKDKERAACVRPRTSPKIKGNTCKHTDYYESN